MIYLFIFGIPILIVIIAYNMNQNEKDLKNAQEKCDKEMSEKIQNEAKNDYRANQINQSTTQNSSFYKEPPNINYTRTFHSKNGYKPNTPKPQKTIQSKNTPGKKYNPNSKRYKCLDGDLVKSKIEREIDDFFFYNDIKHYYEFEYYSVIRQKKCKPDFYLPNYNLYIEYFGLNKEGYNKSKAWKLDLYSSDKYTNFEFLDYNDDKNLYDKLKEICQKYNIPLKK